MTSFGNHAWLDGKMHCLVVESNYTLKYTTEISDMLRHILVRH